MDPEYCDYCKVAIPPDHTTISWDDQSMPCQTCRLVAIRSKEEGGSEVYDNIVRWFLSVLKIDRNMVNTIPYLYENRRDISARVGKKFIPTRAYDPPYVYGLYMRWHKLKRLWKITHLIGIPLAILGVMWVNGLGLIRASLILIGLAVIFILFLLNYLLSYLFSTESDHLIVVHAYYDRDRTERIMAHEIAHFIHNRRHFFAILHNLLDSLLRPFFISYTEGMASWVEWEYSRSKGKPAKLSEFPLIYRNGLRLFQMIEKEFGRDAVLVLLKTF